MECPTCYGEFNLSDKVPRIFGCGHTFCEFCIKNMICRSQTCPFCRLPMRDGKRMEDFPKNFILIDMVDKKQKEREKFDICEKSSKPNVYFCLECKKSFCKDCLHEHSGHKFKITKVREEVSQMHTKVLDTQANVIKYASKVEKNLEGLEALKSERMKQIDEYFDKMAAKLAEVKGNLKKEYNDFCESKESQLTVCLNEYKRHRGKLEVARKKIETLDEEIKTMDCLDSVEKAQIVKNKVKQLEDDISIVGQIKKINVKELPRLHFDRVLIEEVPNIAKIITADQDKPYIMFFGEKNKLLVYDITADKWTLLAMEPDFTNKPCPIEFNYFGSAVTLDTGDVLITGGGISNKAILFSPAELRVKRAAPMKLIKKEHTSIAFGNRVYVLGGYDGERTEFLSECEIYDVSKNEWTMAAPMKRAKCAFAATKVNES